MTLYDTIQGFFGTADKKTLLDDSVYSGEELREDKIRLRKQRESIQKEMNQYKQKYKELIDEGAQADAITRKQLAQQAKIVKKKFKIKKQQYKKNSLVLATVVTIEGARELMEMHGNSTTNIETIIQSGDVDIEQVQEKMTDQMVQFQLDMDLMQSVQDTLDIEIWSADMDTDTGEEEELMKQRAEGKLDTEQLDLEDEVEDDIEEAGDVDFDDIGELSEDIV